MFRKYLLIFALILVPAGVTAQEFLSDAFGLVPVSTLNETDRANWSGLQEHLTPDGAPSAYKALAEPAETLLIFVGPKSAVAGKDKVQAVSIALDRLGNTIADGTDVKFRSGVSEHVMTSTRYGVADWLFMPEPETGAFYIGASIGNRQSVRADFRVVPDLDSVDLSVVLPEHAFQPEAFADLRTPVLQDRFGNAVGDGVAIQMLLEHPDSSFTLGAGLTLADGWQARLLTRGLPSEAEMRLGLGRGKSQPVRFSVSRLNATHVPEVIATEIPDLAAMRLRVGPFLTNAGYMLNDGVPVSLSVSFKNQPAKTIKGWSRDGMFEAVLAGGVDQLPALIKVETDTGHFDLQLDDVSDAGATIDWGME